MQWLVWIKTFIVLYPVWRWLRRRYARRIAKWAIDKQLCPGCRARLPEMYHCDVCEAGHLMDPAPGPVERVRLWENWLRQYPHWQCAGDFPPA